eukprot:snap_masked-scaffold_15-processed-gene-2.63-mRNA-1 protein AED:1.00 eAED:1.00 QI:0/0/0/0/1/1/2/0/68
MNVVAKQDHQKFRVKGKDPAVSTKKLEKMFSVTSPTTSRSSFKPLSTTRALRHRNSSYWSFSGTTLNS